MFCIQCVIQSCTASNVVVLPSIYYELLFLISYKKTPHHPEIRGHQTQWQSCRKRSKGVDWLPGVSVLPPDVSHNDNRHNKDTDTP